jgi:hypothetical protein
MKNIVLFRIILITLFNALVVSTFALPESFEGVITYKIISIDSQHNEIQNAIFPKFLTVTIKGDMARIELITPIGPYVEIINSSLESKITLYTLMNQKVAFKGMSAEMTTDQQNQPKEEIRFTEESREIAGFACKKAIVSTDLNGVKTNFDIWYTTVFGCPNCNFDKPLYEDIKGILFEFYMSTSQFTFKATAISVEEKSISDTEFEIPADYRLMTKEEYSNVFSPKE